MRAHCLFSDPSTVRQVLRPAQVINKAQVAKVLENAKIATTALINLESTIELREAPKVDRIDFEEDVRRLEKDTLTDEEERGIESREADWKPVSATFFFIGEASAGKKTRT